MNLCLSEMSPEIKLDHRYIQCKYSLVSSSNYMLGMFCVLFCFVLLWQTEAEWSNDKGRFGTLLLYLWKFVQQTLKVEKAVLFWIMNEQIHVGPCKLGACLLHELSDNTTSSLLQWLAQWNGYQHESYKLPRKLVCRNSQLVVTWRTSQTWWIGVLSKNEHLLIW